jgi:hypothetical protein
MRWPGSSSDGSRASPSDATRPRGSRHKRYEQDAAREGIALEQLLAVVMIVTLLAQFDAFDPEMPGAPFAGSE